MSPIFLGECMVKISCTCAQNEIDLDFTYSWIDVAGQAVRACIQSASHARACVMHVDCTHTYGVK